MKYRNLYPPYVPHGYGSILKWAAVDRVLGRRRRSPPRAEVPTAVPDRSLLETDRPSLTWVGHATWLIRLAGISLVTDPVWSSSLGPGITRNVDPGLPLDEAAPTVVLVSHNHRDHLDAPTIKAIGDRATYVVPRDLGQFFKRRGMSKVVELAWWEATTIGGVTISFVPSQHWSQRGPTDRNATLWGGFVIEGDGKRIYFAGDTAYFAGFTEIGDRFAGIDAALLPIGAYDPEWFMRKQHMNPEDAVRAFLDLKASLFCAMHWGTFKLTDEPLDEPPRFLEEVRVRERVDRDRVWVAAIGESRAL